jgi:TolB protein
MLAGPQPPSCRRVISSTRGTFIVHSKKRVARRVTVIASMVIGLVGSGIASAQSAGSGLGIFENQSDVGSVVPPGVASFDSASGVYTIRSAGANLWVNVDGFHFVWKKVSGDVSLTADVKLADAGPTANPHRKALLMFRQSLDPDAMYADAAIHGSGETALQYRRNKGDTTQDIAFNIGAPQRMRLEKRGDTITLFLSAHGEPLHQVGASIKLHFDGDFYAGLGVCAHNKDAVEQATFAHVELQPLTTLTTAAPAGPITPASTATPTPAVTPAPMALYSTLETIAIDNNARMAFVIQTGKGQMEAPNWSRDGKTLIFDRAGKLWSVPAAESDGSIAEATSIDIGNATDCTGSHGLSRDGKWLAITCTTPDHPGRRVYIVPGTGAIAPATGGAPRMVTANPDSYFHSWSPDGKTILFTRPAHGALNIFAISPDGGAETALTTGNGVSDDPDFSADGQWIYFNSDRAGGMQIWRMRADGSQPEQVTFDEKHNWTAHPSPDGKSILILSYEKDVAGHAANKDVTLRILNVADGKIRDLVQIVGGSGTDNVPNWAPDGAHFAFVSYQFLPADDNGSTQ